jgi:hypothetical protein
VSRGYQEDRPAPARKRAAQQRQECTIGGSELGTLDLPAQHLDLVAEHRHLHVLGVLAAEASKQHADESASHEVRKDRAIGRLPDLDAHYPGHTPEVPEPTRAHSLGLFAGWHVMGCLYQSWPAWTAICTSMPDDAPAVRFTTESFLP